LLARHGETTWNAEQRVQGQTDAPLSELGRRQAQRLGARLAGEPIAAAYASDLSRAWDTARIALAGRDVPLHPCPGLREINLGRWQGLTGAEIDRRWPGQSERFWDADPDLAPDGGETRRELQARVVASIETIVARHVNELVLVVSHGGALRAFACWILDADLAVSRRLEVDNCGLSVVQLRPARPMLVGWNDVTHLDGLVHPAVGQRPLG
jgi:broad specificity phosphatase PhoE